MQITERCPDCHRVIGLRPAFSWALVALAIAALVYIAST